MMTFMISIYYFCPTGAFRKNQKGIGALKNVKIFKIFFKIWKSFFKIRKNSSKIFLKKEFFSTIQNFLQQLKIFFKN